MPPPPQPPSPSPELGSQRHESFHLLVDSVVDYAIFMLDPTGRVLTWNGGARRIMGYEASEIVGQPFSRFDAEEDVVAGKPARELAEAVERPWRSR